MRAQLFTDLFGARAARRAVGVGAACAALTIAGCGGGDGDAGGYKVRAIFDSAAFVLPGLDVRISGVKVGAVSAIDLTDDNEAAVTFDITDPGFQDFRKDARCTIRPQALIGERYIECDLTEPRPEGASAPAELAEIAEGEFKGQRLLPVDRTAVPVDPDQVLSVNSPSVRDRFSIIIRELGAGVAGRGDEIANALKKGNEGLLYANRVLKQLSDETDMLKQLTSSSDQTLSVLAAERDSLSGTIDNGAVVASRLAARKSELRASIAALNDVVTEVSPSVDRVTELTDELQPIADDLNRSSDDLATVLNLLPEVSSRAETAVTALSPTVNRGREVLTSDSTTALIDRVTRTANAVKASGSVLGLTLGDFRSTGGLDYFLDAIYGLTYATNGRDANGSYLRGAALNLLNCALASNARAGGCGSTLPAEAAAAAGAADAAEGSAARASGSDAGAAPTQDVSTTDAEPTTSAEKTAASLLLGGKQ